MDVNITQQLRKSFIIIQGQRSQMELKSQIISTKPRIYKGRRNPNILYSLSCLVVEHFKHWLSFYIDREIQEKSTLVRTFNSNYQKKKNRYRAPQSLEEKK